MDFIIQRARTTAELRMSVMRINSIGSEIFSRSIQDEDLKHLSSSLIAASSLSLSAMSSLHRLMWGDCLENKIDFFLSMFPEHNNPIGRASLVLLYGELADYVIKMQAEINKVKKKAG